MVKGKGGEGKRGDLMFFLIFMRRSCEYSVSDCLQHRIEKILQKIISELLCHPPHTSHTQTPVFRGP